MKIIHFLSSHTRNTQILQKKSLLLNHFGWGGKGIGGNLISGIGFIKRGFGGGNWDGFIPPFANGKSPIDGTCCFSESIGMLFGWLYTMEGILLIFLGLFSANSLSAKPPCFYPTLLSFFTAYSALICRPEKYCPFICWTAKSEDVKLSKLTNPCPLLVPS